MVVTQNESLSYHVSFQFTDLLRNVATEVIDSDDVVRASRRKKHST